MNRDLIQLFVSLRCGIRDSSRASQAKPSNKEEEIINKLDELILEILNQISTKEPA